jgi:hypothetical protein
MHRIAICGLSGSKNIFLHYLINGTIFEKESLITEYLFWFSLQLLSETFPILKELSEMWSKMYVDLHAKYPLFLSDFNEIGIFATYFRKLLEYQISWKPVQWNKNWLFGGEGGKLLAEPSISLTLWTAQVARELSCYKNLNFNVQKPTINCLIHTL